MASTEQAAVNGTYASQPYDAAVNYTTANVNPYSAQQTQSTAPASGSAQASEIPKDEVGWYFVEQYYTTLSKNPEKLYLFYNKRSQFVSGTEEDKVPVCIGQKSINERIKELDFSDCKVRVTNVDSQGADANIVIQVIGELSNKGQPHKRFVQTFVLAEQTNGYFVLNDIFRYLAEEPEEEEEQVPEEPEASTAAVTETAPTTAAPEIEAANTEAEVATTEGDLNKVDEKLETAAQDETPAAEEAPAVNGTPVPEAEESTKAEEPAAAETLQEPAAKTPEEEKEEEVIEQEKPKEPLPTPVAAAPKATPPPAAPAAPPKPAIPRTWASLAASAHKVATPQAPAAVTPQVPAQPKAAAPAPTPAAAAAAPAQAATPAREASPAGSQNEAAGWQTAGAGHKKEQSRSQNQPPAADPDNKRAYIKNVYSQVEEQSLRAVLSKFGDIVYLDISRAKNCAFVDFKTASGFQNAVNNNPHSVNGLDLHVEERRTRPNAYVQFRGGARGGRGGPVGGQPHRGGAFQGRGGRGGIRGGRPAPQEA